MKARLETLERLFDTLQNQPTEDAERLLRRIRSARSVDGLSSVLTPGDDEVSDGTARPSSSLPQWEETTTSPTSSSSSSWWPRGGRLSEVQSDGYSSRDTLPTSLRSSAHPPSLPSTLSRAGSDMSDASGMLRFVLPDRTLTSRAVDSFFASTGKLFHVFSKAQVTALMDEVYAADSSSPSNRMKKMICCVACVAGIGVQYTADDFQRDLDVMYYNIARHYFVDVFEDEGLDALKACTLLAMYNIMNKAIISVGYVGRFTAALPLVL
jgi:hypothetical protein